MSQQLLRNKSFILMLLSTLFSGIGIGMTLIAIPWTIIKTVESSSLIATMTVVGNIAIVLLLPKLSTHIDIKPKKRVMSALYLIGISTQLFVFTSLWFELAIPMLALLFGSYVISLFIRAGDQVIRLAWSQELFEPSDYQRVAQWLEVTRQAITLLAGGGATLLLKSTGLKWIIFADACSYLIGFLLILCIISRSESKQKQQEKAPKNKEDNTYALVFTFFKERPEYLLITSVTLIPYIVVVAQNILYPAHFSQYLKTTEAAFAFHAVPYAIGALLAPILASRIRLSLENMVTPIFISYLFTIGLIILFRNTTVTYVCLFLFAFLHVSIRIKRDTFLMQETPKKIMGKTKGLFETASSFSRAALALAIGALADAFGIAFTWLLFAFIMATTWLWFISNRSKSKAKITSELP